MFNSFRRIAYWHKRSGGGGWNEVFFCCSVSGWFCSLR